IEAQRANLANAREGIATERGILGDMMATYGDERSAMEASRMAIRENLKGFLEEIQAGSQSEGVRGRAQEMLAQLDLQNAQSAAALEQRAAGTVTIETQRRTGGGRGRGAVQRVTLPSGLVVDVPIDDVTGALK